MYVRALSELRIVRVQTGDKERVVNNAATAILDLEQLLVVRVEQLRICRSTEGVSKETEAGQEHNNERYHDACEGRM
jgi:hypothetical protein